MENLTFEEAVPHVIEQVGDILKSKPMQISLWRVSEGTLIVWFDPEQGRFLNRGVPDGE